MRSTYRDKLLKSSGSCTLTFCQHLKNDESHVIIQNLEYPKYETYKYTNKAKKYRGYHPRPILFQC